jgi:hypothetical protein
VDPDTAECLLMAANGTTDRETAKCWIIAMLRAGLLDSGDGSRGVVAVTVSCPRKSVSPTSPPSSAVSD